MRRRIAVVLGAVACSDGPVARTAAGVPEDWYATVDRTLAERPDVTAVAQVDNRGGCPLRDDAVLNGDKVSTVADGGVVRLRGTIPVVLCSWFSDGCAGSPRHDTQTGYAAQED